ncbi:MAG: apolipoprotein N-acyltransferase [Pseudomonadota bacterium]
MTWRFNKQQLMYSLLFLLSGSLISLSLAPYNIWPAAIIAIVLLLLGMHKTHGKRLYWYAGYFGFGQFASGMYWIYISIHEQSNTPAVIAAPMTVAWCAFLSLFTVLFAALYTKLRAYRESSNPHQTMQLSDVFLVPAIWVLVDALRGVALTGLPWLYIGHAHIDTPLSGWVPIIGVHMNTFIIVLAASAIVYALQKHIRFASFPVITLLALIAGTAVIGQHLKDTEWTTPISDKQASLSLIQANIPQEEKWLPQKRDAILERYASLLSERIRHNTEQGNADQHVYIFPETALPDYAFKLEAYLDEQARKLDDTNSSLFTGIVEYDMLSQQIFNAIFSIGDNPHVYKKQHLVPFGEYIPFQWLRKLSDFFNLPMSNFSSGAPNQSPLQHAGFTFAPLVCFEAVFAKQVRLAARDTHALLTISNLTWFGRSSASAQLMQIAQFRALENGRYLIHATNNGMTGIVNHKGKLIEQLPQFTSGTLTTQVPGYTGNTLYNRWGDRPILIVCLSLLLLSVLIAWRTRQTD